MNNTHCKNKALQSVIFFEIISRDIKRGGRPFEDQGPPRFYIISPLSTTIFPFTQK